MVPVLIEPDKGHGLRGRDIEPSLGVSGLHVFGETVQRDKLAPPQHLCEASAHRPSAKA